ncbi:hypothetical protein [Actinoplanes sp. NPDC049316]|uniref:hypothetical protein n=1 Tax=Actinoplanes sp. NPDC049316 TaxID=3154727 RepID=UPI00342D33B9
MTGSTGTARQEAERLVAALLAMAQGGGKDSAGLGDLLKLFTGTGSQQHNRSTGWATGTAECCVCPICRAIAAVRDPDPHTAERLAAGAGDLATGVASIMRAFATISSVTNAKPQPKPAPPRPEPTPDQAWSTATRAHREPVSEPERPSPVDETTDPWGAATRTPAPTPTSLPAWHEAGTRTAEPAPRKAAPTARMDTVPAGGDLRPRTEESGSPKSVTRLTDPWAAAVANYANGESRGETGVAGTGSVDHDVAAQGTPAPAEDRGGGAGDDARGDDAV